MNLGKKRWVPFAVYSMVELKGDKKNEKYGTKLSKGQLQVTENSIGCWNPIFWARAARGKGHQPYSFGCSSLWSGDGCCVLTEGYQTSSPFLLEAHLPGAVLCHPIWILQDLWPGKAALRWPCSSLGWRIPPTSSSPSASALTEGGTLLQMMWKQLVQVTPLARGRNGNKMQVSGALSNALQF